MSSGREVVIAIIENRTIYGSDAQAVADRILAALEQAGWPQECGKENCMGWKHADTATWVREEGLIAITTERAALQARLDGLTKTLQDICDGNYPSARKNEKCKHGQYGYEHCDECITDAIAAAIQAAT